MGIYTNRIAVIPAGNDIHGLWTPVQICLEQIRINPKGDRQDILT
jgi:hypothetical protein